MRVKQLSNLNTFLLQSFEVKDIARYKWHKDFWENFTDEDLRYTSIMIQKISSNIALREPHYKMQHQLYWLKCMAVLSISAGDVTQHGHLFICGGAVRCWGHFGLQIRNKIQNILGFQFPLMIRCFLLHYFRTLKQAMDSQQFNITFVDGCISISSG